MEKIWDTLVIGAGQAGLASAYHLQKQNVNFLVLEASNQTAGSWPNYYESLTLFSPARYSSLPEYVFPGNPDRYPTKKEVITYLIDYAEHFHFPIRTGEKVKRVQKKDNLFQIETKSGNRFLSKTVIAATGAFSHLYIPDIQGREKYKGRVLHSCYYRNIEEFQHQRVVVVGGGNSAVQIAFELAQVAQVSVSTRKPISFRPQRFLGKDVHFWLTVSGLDRLPLAKDLANKVSVLDTGMYQEAIHNGKPDRREMFVKFTEEGVMWKDGTVEKIDAIIFGTGYRPNVGYLESLPKALNSQGNPIQQNGVSRHIDGLYFVGLNGQRSFASATLRGVGNDAKYVIKKAKSLLKGKIE
jgi:putative flavoprotein involved in K+ transport